MTSDNISELEQRVIDLFPDACIRSLANKRLPNDANLDFFAYGLRSAAYFYLESRSEPSSAKRYAEIERLVKATKSATKALKRPRPLSSEDLLRKLEKARAALSDVSYRSRQTLQDRANRRGLVFPSSSDLADDRAPQAIQSALETIISIGTLGGRWHVPEETQVPDGVTPTVTPEIALEQNAEVARKWWVDVIFAPDSPKNPVKRDAERVFIKQVRAAWRWSIAEGRAASRTSNERERSRLAQEIESKLPKSVPPRASSPDTPSAFASFLVDCAAILGMDQEPKVDIIGVMNDISRSNPRKE